MSKRARGSIVPFAAAGVVTVLLLSLLLGVIGGALVVHRQVRAAADLAALAGASAVQHGHDACDAADHSASLNDVTLMDCEIEGQVVTVRVSRLAPRMFGRDVVVRAIARAGPQ
ncbi:MAG TPA: Rv3654c family TadE-like protein [Nocardioidaceae bacterium]|nr:Rv3654c family TadE-like protein [Nocardioidaceae bacterium]